jgi:hypothetical protein
VLREECAGAFVRGPAGRGDGRANGATVLWISDAGDESVGFEPIDELRDVGLPATVSFGQL